MPFVFESVASIQPPQLLMLTGATLATAIQGEPYSQSMAVQASGGIAPLVFSKLADVGPGLYNTDVTGLITGTPVPNSARITNDGSYRITSLGDVRVDT